MSGAQRDTPSAIRIQLSKRQIPFNYITTGRWARRNVMMEADRFISQLNPFAMNEEYLKQSPSDTTPSLYRRESN